MSNNNSTSTVNPPISTTPSTPDISPSSSPPANPTTSSSAPADVSTTPSGPTSLPPSSTTSPPPSSSSQPLTTTSSEPQPTTTSASPTTTSQAPTTPITTVITSTDGTVTKIETVTQTPPTSNTQTTATTSGAPGVTPSGNTKSGLAEAPKIAIAVVVPIVAVALLILAGIFLWRKRKARKDAEEQRRKELDDYTYNPNADPTIPGVVGGAAAGYEMKEDASSGYRGWGSTTLAGSTGRKASTTMSGGAAAGVAYSDATSPTRGGISDTRSGEAILNDGSQSPEGEILGAMGPSAANNRNGDVRRGPSNASSSYSAAARSDGSGDGIGVAYGDPAYYNQYGSNNPYAEQGYGSPQRPSELGEGPVIRDNPARRNTRIENPAHYPQNAGISQNF